MSEQQPDETDESTTQDSQQDTSSSGGTDQSTSSSSSSSSSSGSETEQDTGEPGEVGDDQLPEDLRPTEDNPLARHPDQTGDEDDAIGQDTEGEPQTAPLHEGQADYGSGAQDSGDSGEGSGSGHTGGDGTQDGRADAEESDGSEELENGGGGAG